LAYFGEQVGICRTNAIRVLKLYWCLPYSYYKQPFRSAKFAVSSLTRPFYFHRG